MSYLKFSNKSLLKLFFEGKLNILLDTPAWVINSININYLDTQAMCLLNIEFTNSSQISLSLLEYDITDIKVESLDIIIQNSQKFLIQEKDILMNEMLLNPLYYQAIQRIFNDDETLAFESFLKIFSNLIFQIVIFLQKNSHRN